MDAIEKRARAVETLARALADEYQDDSLARDVVGSLKAGQLELLNTRIAIRAIIAALTPPEGYVLVQENQLRHLLSEAITSVEFIAGRGQSKRLAMRVSEQAWALVESIPARRKVP
ncbi:hypothetical protein [Stenotrophomonas maltophilia]|uniref:hypothetical protein n=1 Tax=Stenotrophomonas maltophilia TaxID=40324 RepID=UPI0005B6DE2C|nr:hypothetical protein [Stenotrophomonas maltophilia]KIS38448.1 hypothetical protein WJ66_00450 [Stenotrophomonas maltophilia WJ66]MCF3460811.1 hypothetical protein [Stenotrophomonas maltophilia]MCF3517728.1 hypothetical protein [Stenotrophomonas maltophilia]